MKKIILSLLAFVMTLPVFAQDYQSFELGLTFSPLISWLKADGSNASSDGARFGFQYGLLGDIGLGENYAFSTGILIDHYGGSILYFEDDAATENVTHKYNLQFIEVPLTLKLKTNEIGYLTYYGQIGLTPSVRLRARADLDTPFPADINPQPVTVEDLNANEYTNIVNVALTVGAGVHYSIAGNTNLVLGVWFNNGFINQVKDQKYDNNTGKDLDDQISLNYIGIRAGVMF